MVTGQNMLPYAYFFIYKYLFKMYTSMSGVPFKFILITFSTFYNVARVFLFYSSVSK